MLHQLTAAATAGVEKTRIATSALKLGMYVAQLDRAWVESPFLIQGFTIQNKQQLQQLRDACRYVYIDIKRSTLRTAMLSKPEKAVDYETTVSLADNFNNTLAVRKVAKNVVDNMFNAFANNQLFSIDDAKSSISQCASNIIANPESMLWLSMIKNKDDYTAEHSLNVAMLSMTLGRAEGLDREPLEHLGICALLHDIGKVKIPDDILQKEGHLDSDEYETMKMHTVHGHKLLLNQPNIPEAASYTALLHHEKIDGTGYPQGMSGSEIPYMVRIVAIADAYDAMTSGRVYCDAKSASEALKLLLASKNTHHDGDLLDRFIECIGVYPIGSVAELNSGEAGIVMPSNHANKLQPEIFVTRDALKQECTPLRINLATNQRTSSDRPYMIRALHADGTFGIHLADYQTLPLTRPY